MADQLAAFVDQPQHLQTITWGDAAAGGVQVRVRLTWRERVAAWYLDLFEPAGVAEAGTASAVGPPIVLGRRVSPRFAPLLGLVLEGLPSPREAFAFVDAPIRSDPYLRSDLGEVVRLLLLDDAEIAAALATLVPDPETAIEVVS